eukprot:Skav233077  [mRNA]  locus=scaffold1468:294711:294941:- [translate_table: standard]
MWPPSILGLGNLVVIPGPGSCQVYSDASADQISAVAEAVKRRCPVASSVVAPCGTSLLSTSQTKMAGDEKWCWQTW